MGQKVNPIILRIGYIENWRSLWFSEKKDFSRNVIQDYRIRKFINTKFEQAAIAKIVIERLAEKIRIIIHTARPGVVIGRRGADVEKLKSELSEMLKIKSTDQILIEPKEIKNPSIEAQLISQSIAFQLEKRVAFRRAMKRAIDQAMTSGAKGIRIKCSGRLNGAEMARSESYKVGKLPLQTLRANIDYGFAEAHTTYGLIGVKTWVNKGEIIKEIKRKQEEIPAVQAPKE